jgi:hypothetical protein
LVYSGAWGKLIHEKKQKSKAALEIDAAMQQNAFEKGFQLDKIRQKIISRNTRQEETDDHSV